MIERELPPPVAAGLRFLELLARLTLLTVRIVVAAVVVVTVVALLTGVSSPLEALATTLLASGAYAICSPSLHSRFIYEPLGFWRCAWVATRLGHGRWRNQPHAGAIIAAARASLVARDADKALAALTSSLRRLSSFDGAAVVAAAAVRIAAGRNDGVSRTLEGLFELDPAAVPRAAASLAREYLALSAAEHGDWRAARSHGRAKHGTGLSRFVGDLAALRLGQRATWIRVRWLLAPNRRYNALALRAARSAPMRIPVSPPKSPPFDSHRSAGEGLRYFVAHTAAASTTSGGLSQLLVAAESIESDAAFRDHVRSRARALGIPQHADAVLGAVNAELFAALQARAQDLDSRFEELRSTGALGGRVARVLRDRTLTSVEQAFESLQGRCAEERILPAADEWSDWLRCVDLFEAAADRGGDETRQLLWPVVHKFACEYGVWLHGHPAYRVLGNAVFRFLLREAERLGDESAIALQRGNVAAGI